MQAADIRFTLYPVGFIISAVFLAATLAAGWLLPASHHVLHWRCQTHHVACLMLGDLLMSIIQLAGESLHGGSCKVLGESLSFIALFFLSSPPDPSTVTPSWEILQGDLYHTKRGHTRVTIGLRNCR